MKFNLEIYFGGFTDPLKIEKVQFGNCTDIYEVRSLLNNHDPFINIGDKIINKDKISMIVIVKVDNENN